MSGSIICCLCFFLGSLAAVLYLSIAENEDKLPQKEAAKALSKDGDAKLPSSDQIVMMTADHLRAECLKPADNWQNRGGYCLKTNYLQLMKKARSESSQYLIALRCVNNKTQRDIARELSLRSNKISMWENDVPMPVYMARKISKHYRVPINRLILNKSKR